MTLRPIVIAIAMFIAAAIPVAQLRLATDTPTCCCPDPDTCKCADHQPEPGTPTMRACHGGQDDLVRTQLPQFTPPVVIAVAHVERPVAVVAIDISSPHPAPAPRRPDAPS